MSKVFKRYEELQFRLYEIVSKYKIYHLKYNHYHPAETVILNEMDTVWLELTDKEQNILNGIGIKALWYRFKRELDPKYPKEKDMGFKVFK